MKNDVSQEEDCSTKQEQSDEKIDLFVILRRELLEGRLSLNREDDRACKTIAFKTTTKMNIMKDDQSEEFERTFYLNSLINFEPVNRFKNRRNVMKFRGFGDSTSSSI